MKIIDLDNSIPSLNKLVNLDIEVKKSYSLKKFVNSLNDKLKAFNEVKNDLIKKYGEEKDGVFSVKDENIQTFIDEIEKINEEVEIEIPEISIDDIKGGQISAKDLITLDFIIK